MDALEGFWAFYLGTLIMGWGLLALLVGPPLAGTYLHLLHSVVSLYGLHWMKGATDTDNVYGVDTGALTFWEQIDDGKQWTSKRKAFFAVPIFLYLLATNTAPMNSSPWRSISRPWASSCWPSCLSCTGCGSWGSTRAAGASRAGGPAPVPRLEERGGGC